jgi:hypothetical protein
MRTFLFLFAIVLILWIGLSFRNGWFPFAWGSNSGILPHSEWEESLIGRWDFKQEEKNDNVEWAFAGQIEFFQDKKSSINVTIEYYEKGSFGHFYLRGRTGGTLQVEWRILDNGFKLDTFYNCNLNASIPVQIYNFRAENYFSCSDFYNKVFGNVDGNLQTKLKVFSRSKILIKGKRYSDNSTIEYSFTRSE